MTTATATTSRTLARTIALSGAGIFSPLPSTLTIRPAPAGHGLTFRRTDLADQPAFHATVGHVVTRPRQTVLSPNPAAAAPGVHTVEHILSALHALGVTDAALELSGPEIPMLDASSLPFARAILEAGIAPAAPPMPDSASASSASHHAPITLDRPIEVSLGDAHIIASPADGPYLDLAYHLDYGERSPIRSQSASFRLDYIRPDTVAYLRDIAPARTFCTDTEADEFRTVGAFAHLHPHDVLVIGPSGPQGPALRFENEPARHKILDLLGDLALAARPVHAVIVSRRSGHALNHALVRALLEH